MSYYDECFENDNELNLTVLDILENMAEKRTQLSAFGADYDGVGELAVVVATGRVAELLKDFIGTTLAEYPDLDINLEEE